MTSSAPAEYSQSVERRNYKAPALEKIPVPLTGHPEHPGADRADRRLNICVIFTSVASTLAALREAGALANNLGGRITLLAPQVVPYPLPLENSPVLVEFNEQRFRVIASQSRLETRVHVCLCRDRVQAVISVLGPDRAIVVIGGRRRLWWPTGDEMLARALRRRGHEVIFKETK